VTKPILFYSTRDEHGWMSNFYASPFVLRGKTWPTSEHYFQAQRADWERVKDEIMLEALRAKFSQNPDLRSKLLATAPASLVEHTKNDRYWADGGDGTGRNRLGELLMQVREELRTP
jgi:predicted NAD-dependent protein-ADP-ribosyltransferase YbiA (DUF1768 family)